MPVYTVNGQTLHTVEDGPPDRQVAILLHGWSSSWYAMSPLMPIISQRFHAIAIDLPGYGQSPPLEERATITAYVDLLAELIAQIAEGPVVLIGHSMGGMISIALALRYPVLVERLVLICPTISGRLSGFINAFISPITILERFGLGSLIVSVVESLFVGVTDRLMRPASFAERTDITEQDYKRLLADARRPGQGRTRAECFLAMREHDLRGRLDAIETPGLVLWGAEDNTVPLRDASVVADEWPSAELRIIPKAGHWPHFETPETTWRQISSFLGLPIVGASLLESRNDDLGRIDEAARFLAHSDVGNNLNEPQRSRLAAQFGHRELKSGEYLVHIRESGNELFIVQSGTIEVWSEPEKPVEEATNLRRVATYTPGQLTGELAMLDGGIRSADLRAGPEGATVLSLSRERLLALTEADTELGSHLLWNIATTMALRVRFILWQMRRVEKHAISVDDQSLPEITNSPN